ncbi:class F sortase [Phycicoccus avicenniae]|uniref:class F sortase n=1 Tax=Phycicoccus avicenniae TaxID=2828860 RepID=UPI003D2D366F
MSTTPESRRWSVAAACAALVALVAGAALTGWVLTRPDDTAGDGLAALRTPAATTSAPPPTPEATPSVRATPRATEATAAAPRPVRLRIPDLGVDASVRPVGVQRDGGMVIPAEPTSVGWYRYGRAPADPLGHTVIAGHVATREDGPGALAPLAGAEEGMRVEVLDADGVRHRYVVRGRENIRKKALPVDEIFAREGRPLLVLVTCGGEYLPELRSHRDNVVVTAEPAG